MLRLYTANSKHSPKVIYNLLIEAFFSDNSHTQALECLIDLFQQTYDKKPIINALRENYPHKLCPLETHLLYLTNMIQLARSIKNYRTDFLEIIVENLANFDTELVLGDEWVHKPFPNDKQVLEMRGKTTNELASKFDALLSKLLGYLSELAEDDTILN
jgi:hypothetical protein